MINVTSQIIIQVTDIGTRMEIPQDRLPYIN